MRLLLRVRVSASWSAVQITMQYCILRSQGVGAQGSVDGRKAMT